MHTRKALRLLCRQPSRGGKWTFSAGLHAFANKMQWQDLNTRPHQSSVVVPSPYSRWPYQKLLPLNVGKIFFVCDLPTLEALKQMEHNLLLIVNNTKSL